MVRVATDALGRVISDTIMPRVADRDPRYQVSVSRPARIPATGHRGSVAITGCRYQPALHQHAAAIHRQHLTRAVGLTHQIEIGLGNLLALADMADREFFRRLPI